MALEEAELMLISSTLAEMMPHDMMIVPLAGMYGKSADDDLFLLRLFIICSYYE